MKKSWIYGAKSTAPGANTQLVKIITTANKLGLVYGFYYVSQEAAAAGKIADLRINIAGTAVAPLSFDVVANMPAFVSRDPLVVLKGNGADYIEVINLVAGTAAAIHRVALLYGEIDFPWDFYADGGADQGQSGGQRNGF